MKEVEQESKKQREILILAERSLCLAIKHEYLELDYKAGKERIFAPRPPRSDSIRSFHFSGHHPVFIGLPLDS